MDTIAGDIAPPYHASDFSGVGALTSDLTGRYEVGTQRVRTQLWVRVERPISRVPAQHTTLRRYPFRVASPQGLAATSLPARGQAGTLLEQA